MIQRNTSIGLHRILYAGQSHWTIRTKLLSLVETPGTPLVPEVFALNHLHEDLSRRGGRVEMSVFRHGVSATVQFSRDAGVTSDSWGTALGKSAKPILTLRLPSAGDSAIPFWRASVFGSRERDTKSL